MAWTVVNCSGPTGTYPQEGRPIDYCQLQPRDASRFASRSCRSPVPVVKTEDRAPSFCIQVCPPRNPEHISIGLKHWFSAKPEKAASLRDTNSIQLPRPKKSLLMHSPLYVSMSFGIICLNMLLLLLRLIPSGIL